MAFNQCPNFVSAQYLGNKLMEFDQICICIDIEKIQVGIGMGQFSLIYYRVMSLD